MIEKFHRLTHTFTFRLAMIYVAVFSFSVVVLFAFISVFAENYLESQSRDVIKARYQQLLSEYQNSGSSGVEERINDLIRSDEESTEIYLLINREGEKMAGNMGAWPQYQTTLEAFEKQGKWIKFFIEGSRTTPERVEVRAIEIPLSKWRTLLVGQSLQNYHRVRQTLMQTFWASLAITLLMAFVGAYIMTKSVERRITVINRSAAKIMQGTLSERIPVQGGGDEFDELSENLNAMLERIEVLMQSLKDFANNIAHDLRTPLNRIIARTETGLRRLSADSAVSELLVDNIRDMQELIATFNAILSISELESNPTAQLKPLEVTAVLTNMVELYEPYAYEKSIELTLFTPSKIIIEADKHLLSQALANLLDNAIKFTPMGGRIDVSMKDENGHALITIADSGPGIPSEMRQKVFEKFYRLEQSRNSKGNGLGLSLVGAIVKLHQGEITLGDNHPGLVVELAFKLYAEPDGASGLL